MRALHEIPIGQAKFSKVRINLEESNFFVMGGGKHESAKLLDYGLNYTMRTEDQRTLWAREGGTDGKPMEPMKLMGNQWD